MKKLAFILSTLVLVVSLSTQASTATAHEEKDNYGMRWPVASHMVTATFHDPNYIFRAIFQHDAIDIAIPQGMPVYAAKDGVVAVTKIDKNSIDYAYVLLTHKHNLSTVYGEVSKVLVKEGETVKRGQLIAYGGGLPGTVGAGAYTTGPHLHFSVRLNGIPVDPLLYLKK
jgi:murein DD-endopeptidase MepM/ murein hydrolase activator NlpD